MRGAGRRLDVAQVAYAVADLDVAARTWADSFGAGPFLVRHHPPLRAQDAAGAPAVFAHSSAYGQWGAVQVELLQVHEGTSATLGAVVPGGPGLHHVAVFVDDLAGAGRELAARGWPRVMTAWTSSGLAFAFHDARAELGHLVEVYEPQPPLLALYTSVARAAQGWDGRDPVRPLTAPEAGPTVPVT